MTNKTVANIPASVRQRLLNISKVQKEYFNLTLDTYAIERLLARLERSDYTGQFVLKGAQVFKLWMNARHRPTRDLDLLRLGLSDIETLESIIKAVCVVRVEEDGITFLPETVLCEASRSDDIYNGYKMTLDYTLDSARSKLQIDFGVGDATVPQPTQVELSSLLGFAPVRMLAYSGVTFS
jgi:hypothetical protein